MPSGFYPSTPSAPLRTFVTADAGPPVHTEFTGAVSAGQVITGTSRALTSQLFGLMVNVAGLSEAADVAAVMVSTSQGDFSLPPITAGGVTAWVFNPAHGNACGRTWGGSSAFTVSVKFAKARAAVTVRCQETPF